MAEPLDARLGYARDRCLRAVLRKACGSTMRLPAWCRRSRQRRRRAAQRACFWRVVCRAWARLRRSTLAQGGTGEHGGHLRGRACACQRYGRAARHTGRACGGCGRADLEPCGVARRRWCPGRARWRSASERRSERARHSRKRNAPRARGGHALWRATTGARSHCLSAQSARGFPTMSSRPASASPTSRSHRSR